MEESNSTIGYKVNDCQERRKLAVFAARSDFDSAQVKYDNNWRTLDENLYRLGRENPKHDQMRSVCAKLWIMGRTYATGIERKIATTGAQGSSMSQVAKHFHAQATEIDKLFWELASVVEPPTPENLTAIVCIHGRLVELICPLTRRGQSPRSFVSKYMHFHNAAVPIYDSVAVRTLRSAVPWDKCVVGVRDSEVRRQRIRMVPDAFPFSLQFHP